MFAVIRPRFPDLLLLIVLGLSLVGVGLAGSRTWTAASGWPTLPLPGNEMLQEGDLVLRRGRGIISESLRLFSLEDPAFSHAGILVRRNGAWMVLHALGGEDNPSDKLLAEPLAAFCRSDLNSSIRFVRLDLDACNRRRLVETALRRYALGPSFDSDFDLETDDRLYCTEFIYKAVIEATGDTKYLPLTRLSGREYVACDNLYRNRHARILYTYPSNRTE